MTESIWIAIIGAVGVIGAAIIGLFKKSDKSKSNAKTTVNQTVCSTTLIISKKPGNTGISRDIRTEFTTDLLLSD